MFCSKCGSAVNDERFCPKCGNRVMQGQAPEIAASANKAAKKSKKGLIAVLSTIGVVAVGAAVAAVMFTSKSPAEKLAIKAIESIFDKDAKGIMECLSDPIYEGLRDEEWSESTSLRTVKKEYLESIEEDLEDDLAGEDLEGLLDEDVEINLLYSETLARADFDGYLDAFDAIGFDTIIDLDSIDEIVMVDYEIVTEEGSIRGKDVVFKYEGEWNSYMVYDTFIY